MQDALEKSDHLMATAQDLFVDFPRRRTGKVSNLDKSFFSALTTNGYLEEFKIFFRHCVIYILSILEWVTYKSYQPYIHYNLFFTKNINL